LSYMDEEMYYGQATDDGAYDDVDVHGVDGTVGALSAAPDMAMAWGLVALSLLGLWLLGAAVFKGSNQS
jgi:hypothetical protein